MGLKSAQNFFYTRFGVYHVFFVGVPGHLFDHIRPLLVRKFTCTIGAIKGYVCSNCYMVGKKSNNVADFWMEKVTMLFSR
jgi:hypothetical protein